MNGDDLILTPLSPDNDEALRQSGKSIKIFKSFQLNISRKYSHSQKFSETSLLQKEENLVEQLTVQLVTDEAAKTAIDDESVTKKPWDNSFKVMPLDKQKLISPLTRSSNKKEINNNKEIMHHRRQKGQNKINNKEKIDRKNSSDSIDNNTLSSTSECFPADSLPNNNVIPFDISQNLSSKRLRKKDKKNLLMDDGTIVTSYSITHPKRNRDFHNFFKNIPHNEYLINDYACALQREILLQGRIFVSLHNICFHSNIFSRVTDIVIPFSNITSIEKKLTAFVIPNAIQISVGNTKYSFTSFLSRDSVYDLLVKLWDYSNASENRTFDDFNEIIEKEHEESRSEMSESSDTQSSVNCRDDIPKYLQEDSKVSLIENNNISSKEDNSTSSIEDNNISQIEDSVTFPTKKDSKIHNETTCDCLKNNQHFNNVVWDTTFKSSAEKIYNLLYASEFISEFLRETDDSATTKCNFEVLHKDFDKYVTIMKYTQVSNVPSSRGFTAKTRTCIMQAAPDITRVIVTSAIESSSIPSVNKFTIEKSYFEGRLAYYKKLETAIHKYISQNLTEFDPDMSPSAITKEDKDVDKIHSSKKQNFIKKRKRYLNEDIIRNKLRIPMTLTLPTMPNIILIAIILTVVTNIFYLVYLKNINDAINASIDARFTERPSECVGETCPLNEWLYELRKRQLSSILNENI